MTGIFLYCFIFAGTFAESTTISVWKIFYSIRSPKLSLTAPANMPCATGISKKLVRYSSDNIIASGFLLLSQLLIYKMDKEGIIARTVWLYNTPIFRICASISVSR